MSGRLVRCASLFSIHYQQPIDWIIPLLRRAYITTDERGNTSDALLKWIGKIIPKTLKELQNYQLFSIVLWELYPEKRKKKNT